VCCFPFDVTRQFGLQANDDILESTLKRHGYYCRSRKAVSNPRPRSCISCAKGKTRCDRKGPGCSKCLAKGIDCHYPPISSKETESRTSVRNNAADEHPRSPPSLAAFSPWLEDRPEDHNHVDTILDNSLILSEPDIADIGGESLDWNDQDFDFEEFLNPQSNDEPMQDRSTTSSSTIQHLTPPIHQIDTSYLQRFSINCSLPAVPISAVRALIQRPRLETGARRISNLILHTMKSYALMMLRDGNLPPFIHPHLISSHADDDFMEPLANGISLVHMISTGLKGSRKLFWRNVRLECERLHAEVV
jgi:hypothetical protein